MPGHVHHGCFPREFANSGSTGVQESCQRVLRRLSRWLSISGGLRGASGGSHEEELGGTAVVVALWATQTWRAGDVEGVGHDR